MVDVRGDVLRPPHGTTPAAVKSNKNQKWDSLRAMKTALDSFQKEVYLSTVSYCIALLYLEPIIWGLSARLIL